MFDSYNACALRQKKQMYRHIGLLFVVTLKWCNDVMQVNVTVGKTVVLSCSLIPNDSSVQWVRMDLQLIYSNGDVVNPELKNRNRYDVIGDQKDGEFNFQIKQVTKYDEGIYRCDTKIEGKAVSAVVSLKVYENQEKSKKNRTEIGNQNENQDNSEKNYTEIGNHNENQDNSEKNYTEIGNHNVQGFSLYTYMSIIGGAIISVVIIPMITAFGIRQFKHMYEKCHQKYNSPDQGIEAENNYDDIDDIEISELRVFNINNGNGITIDHYVNERIDTEPGSHVLLGESNSNFYQILTDNRQSTNGPYDELAPDLHSHDC